MPDSCCIVNCTSRRVKGKNSLSFYNIPKGKTPIEKRRREDWIRAVDREDWKDWSYEQISKAMVCSAHFVSGKRSDDPDDIDWRPTVFSHAKKKNISELVKIDQRKKRYKAIAKKRDKKIKLKEVVEQPPPPQQKCEDKDGSGEELSTIDFTLDDAGPSYIQPLMMEVNDLKAELSEVKTKLVNINQELVERNMEVYTLRDQVKTLKANRFGFQSIKMSNEKINFFAGVENNHVFGWILNKVRPYVSSLHSRLSLEDHLLVVLMKIKLGLYNKDIAIRFGVTSTTISKIFRSWVPILHDQLKFLIVWPDRGAIRYNLPNCFKKKYRDAVCIIDCSEIFIQRPTNLTARAQSWSNYKHNNTVKYLIGISPAGAVMFLSCGWGGRVSDKQITIESGFLDKLETGDCILADRGFNITKEIASKGATLKIPSFTKGKKQLSGTEVDMSRQLSNVRIHVERVIGRIKKFRILSSYIPVTQVDIIDEIMVTICALVNLNSSVVR